MHTLIYAHRGASKEAPENTMPAFELAYQSGADGIEVDVQLTKDNIPILIHDENVRRTTTGTGFVQDYTYKELSKLDAGIWHSEKYKHTKLASLDDLLQWNLDKQLKLNIELKNNLIQYKNIEEIVYRKLVEYNMVHQSIISTFNRNSLIELNKIDKNIVTAVLTSKQRRNLIEDSMQLQANGVHIRFRLLNKRLVEVANKNDMFVSVYTVNQSIWMKKVFKYGCQGIITDVPYIANQIKSNFKATL
ncbi:glycerophosphodiester phosphodiesterase [Gracilibacillus marinus]|uniref:Glycerophosphodiester phosphodiesterase n=1 Tax=Gracilibacillus marinus TaxID=630535 RepID=A0ABV8VWP2_9BACI